jgi:hypothetical protein
MNQENNMPFYQVVFNLLNPFNYLFGCGDTKFKSRPPEVTQS